MRMTKDNNTYIYATPLASRLAADDMGPTIQFYCILGSYIGCLLFLMAAFITIYDLFDEIAEFRERVEKDLADFTKYSDEVCRTMALRPKMTERYI
ncbi:hypothetical protein V3C99_004670 [Haemonchus contortus]